MSDRSIEIPRRQCRGRVILSICRLLLCAAGLVGIGFLPPAVDGADTAAGQASVPLLVRARQGDTPVSLARRYLNDGSMGWFIAEYNGLVSFADGQAVLIPAAPFRLGGLHPTGYQTVPVLAYAAPGDSTGAGAQVSRVAFEEQMNWLSNGGFTTITPDQIIDFMELKAQLPQGAVMVTADTESSIFYDQMAPILRSFGLTATVFVATRHVGRPGNMTWDQLGRLKAQGFNIGCRGHDGRPMIRKRRGQPLESRFKAIQTDLKLAKQTIERQLGDACTVMAYPDGQSDDLVAAIAAKLGFLAAFVRSSGENPFFGGRFAIHRVVVDRRMDPGTFTQMLTTRVSVDLH